jgi:hypothetical protein
MNSREKILNKHSAADVITYKDLLNENTRKPQHFLERNSSDFRFVPSISKISQILNSPKISKKRLLTNITKPHKDINYYSCNNHSNLQIRKDFKIKYYTTNISEVKKIIIPSIEKFKSNVKETMTSTLLLI